jgi:hypothetical protein
MFLKRFLKPKSYNTYWAPGPGTIYQIDLFSLSGLLTLVGRKEEETIYGHKGPWVLACIDMHSRYLETQYVGYSSKMTLVIDALDTILVKMGKPLQIQADEQFNTKEFRDVCRANDIRYLFWKPHEEPKNQIVERAIRTIKQFMMKYIYKYGFPDSDNLEDDVQQVLDACTWYYNRIWHTGINAIPFEVFFGYDDNRQKIVLDDYPRIPIRSLVFRKPIRLQSNVPLTVYHVDPEPFIVEDYRGGKRVGKYQLRSAITLEEDPRWYKPYELRVISRSDYDIVFHSPLFVKYITSKYGEHALNMFYARLPVI